MAFGGVHPFMLKSGSGGGGGGGGDLFSVTPCAGPGDVLCSDPNDYASGGMGLGDIVQYTADDENYYCGTISATGQSGVEQYAIDSDGYSDCEECEGPGGP